MRGAPVVLDPHAADYPRRLDVLGLRRPRLHAVGTLGEPARSVAIVGARAATAADAATAHALALHAARAGVSVISGGALGIDAAAHAGALAGGGHTVVVLGTGLDVIYPDRHADLFAAITAAGGALVTAYPAGTPPRAGNFVRRNQLIAALADLVVVVSAQVRSGALHTARAALRFGRRLAATPGSPGTRMLVSAGAWPVADGAALDDAFAGRRRAQARPEPSARGQVVLRALAAAPRPIGADELATDATLALSLGGIALALHELEASGWILPMPGGVYQCAR
jgi:DNA processing protein